MLLSCGLKKSRCVFVQKAEPGPPKSRDEKSIYPEAAGTQKRLVQIRPGAGVLCTTGWAGMFQEKNSQKYEEPSKEAIAVSGVWAQGWC
jgi:hypothetical protein